MGASVPSLATSPITRMICPIPGTLDNCPVAAIEPTAPDHAPRRKRSPIPLLSHSASSSLGLIVAPCCWAAALAGMWACATSILPTRRFCSPPPEVGAEGDVGASGGVPPAPPPAVATVGAPAVVEEEVEPTDWPLPEAPPAVAMACAFCRLTSPAASAPPNSPFTFALPSLPPRGTPRS